MAEASLANKFSPSPTPTIKGEPRLAPTPLGPAAFAWDHKKDVARVAVTAGQGALHGVESGAHWLGIP